jgi:hypothetical protein
MMWRNCTVWLAGIVAVSGAGCVVDGSDSSAIRVRWNVEYVDGSPATCDGLGTPSVTVVAQNLNTATKFSTMVPCSDGLAVTSKLPSGPYAVTLSLLDAKGRAVAVVDYQGVQTRNSGVTEPDTIAVFPVQAWDLAWVVQKVVGGTTRPSSCQEVGAKTVEFSWQLAGEPAEAVEFLCAAYQGSSPAIRTGLYQAQMRLLNPDRQPLSDTGAMSRRVTGDPQSAAIDAELLVQ